MCIRETIAILLFFCFSLLHALPKSGESTRTEGRTTVSNSEISAETQGSIAAINESRINAGIKAKNSDISDSSLFSKTDADIKAANYSNVNTGIKADNANISDSTISASTKAGKIDANNSKVTTGVDIEGAANSEISTNVSAENIIARDSNVNVGSVKGNADGKKISTNVSIDHVNAVNETVNIGNVSLNDTIGRNSRIFKDRDDVVDPSRNTAKTSVGNVTVESNRVKEVNVTVGDGSGNVSEKIKARHMSEVYSKKGGTDPSGTKHVFVSDKDKKKAERENGTAGDTTIERGSKVKKLDVYVEE